MFPRWLAGLIFFSILGLLVGSQLFWFRRARDLVRRCDLAWQRWLVGVPLYGWFLGLAGIFLLAPLRWVLRGDAPVLLSLLQQVRRPEVMIPVGLWLMASLFSFLLIVVVRAPALVASAVRRWRGASVPQPERRYFLQSAVYAAGALPFVMVGYGFLIGRQNYSVQEVTLPIPNLPDGLEGLRLLQLTDVHTSAYMTVKELARVVGLAKELEPDLVFHTGDFITGPGDPLAAAIAELSRVPAVYGVFGCLGNHEIYARATEAATELFARRDVRILRGENAEVEIRGAKLNLIGVDYQRQPRFNRGQPRGLRLERWQDYFLRGVERLVQRDALNILLSHNPNPFLRAAALGIDLTIAGHTHGGQVQVEILDSRWSPARFITPFVSGLYERPAGVPLGRRSVGPGRSFLYVSRGIGTIAAPVRLNAPPEITLLTLRRGAGARLRG
ncbi:MAG: metallophosphoesterase [Terriglobia bacterium]